MTVVLATVAAIFLMMPGFAFIAGVNVTDKNIREIVFRGTPAEVAYVVAVSLVVHLAFALICPRSFSLGALSVDYARNAAAQAAGATQAAADLPRAVLDALAYVSGSAVAGFPFGLLFGFLVRWKRPKFFVKHRWMLGLAGASGDNAVYVRALTAPAFSRGKKLGDGAIMVEGTIRDCYFAADGTLLYLVFSSFVEAAVDLTSPPFLDRPPRAVATVPLVQSGTSLGAMDHLILEGRHVAAARYEFVPTTGLKGGTAALSRAVEDEL